MIIGYFFGLIETGVIYGKITNVDLRKQGSGNTGATNTLRVAGKKAGAIVLIGDMAKCAIPCLIAWLLFKSYGGDVKIFMFAAGLGAILGHNFPFYMGFKGGKGVACSAALALILDPLVAIISAAIFFAIAIGSGYVSIASMVGIGCVYAGLLIHEFLLGGYGLSAVGRVELVILGMVMLGLCIFQHRANIKRLLNGTENKFSTKKKK
jgi:glycerol-3-phosphate acyltransferase PlsY